MKNKKVDKLFAAATAVLVLFGIIMLVSGLFFGDYFDKYYADTPCVGVMVGMHRLVRLIGYKPIAIVMSVIFIGLPVVLAFKKDALFNDDEEETLVGESE